MIHNRRKTNKNKRPYKSSTDINNYNKFLQELDNKHKENKKPIEKVDNSTSSPFSLQDKNPFAKNADKYNSNNANNKTNNKTNNKYNKNNIKIFVKDSNDTFIKNGFSEPSFTGITAWEAFINQIEKHLEPNTCEKKDILETEKKVDNPVVKKKEKPVYSKKETIIVDINNVGDLLQLIEKYPDDDETEYNVDMKVLHKIKEPLSELNSMIGMKELKENIVDQILFYIQNLHTLGSNGGNDFMHTVIYGPPGTGKTEIAKIIGSIFSKLNILSKGTFKKVTRADLVAGYLGQTALKTRDVVKECLGGVLFIDEAYALGNEEKRDSFSKECIDTLCESLSDHKHNLMVIIAGYESDLNNCFFNYNQGLNSRFTWRFKTGEYSAEDLYKIFVKKVSDGGWCLAENSGINVKWFEKHKTHFKFYGRDIETLFAKTKIAHSKRVFCLDASVKKHLTLKDIEKGLEIYLRNDSSQNKDEHNKVISSMYV